MESIGDVSCECMQVHEQTLINPNVSLNPSTSMNKQLQDSFSSDDSNPSSIEMEDFDEQDHQCIDPHKSRKKTFTKQDKIYGIFNEESDNESQYQNKARNFAGVAFVPSKSADAMDQSDGELHNNSQEVEAENSWDMRPRLGLGNNSLKEMESMEFSSSKSNSQIKHQPTKHAANIKNFASFEKYTKGIGSKLLMKMGYEPGKGLGRDGSGIAEPIDVKLRPQKMGLGHGGFDERTETVKKEMKKKEVEEVKQPSWKKSKQKLKFAYKTAEQLIQEQMQEIALTKAEPTKILDMTQKEARILADASEMKKFKVSRIPELVYNIELLSTSYQNQLLRESRSLKDGKLELKSLLSERSNLKAKLSQDSALLEHLSRLVCIIQDIKKGMDLLVNESEITWDALWEAFHSEFNQLEEEFSTQWLEYNLDTVVVSALYPSMHRLMSNWSVLEYPEDGSNVLKQWQTILNRQVLQADDHQLNRNRPMTSYEYALYTLWLPKIRQAINMEFNAKQPDSIVQLLDTWIPLLPKWLCHHLFEQHILPKLNKEIDAWNPKKDALLPHIWLFPWLPIASQIFEDAKIWEKVRQKMNAGLSDWHPRDEKAINMILPWKQVFTPMQMDQFISRTILGKLVMLMRLEFEVNPANQDLFALERVLEWFNAQLLSIESTVYLLETELFPKWHQVLFKWLTSPNVSYEDITQWYSLWKNLFPVELKDQLQQQFRFGLDLMNQAMIGALHQLPPLPTPLALQKEKLPIATQPTKKREQLTFIDYIGLLAADKGIEFVPLVGKVHVPSGKPLYKLANAKGKSCLVYIDNGILLVQQNDTWAPKSVQDVVDSLCQ